MQSSDRVLVIACGALAREITAVKRASGWSALDVTCLPPELHNRPEKIPAAVCAAIREARERYTRIFVAYADCGTGGALDRMLAEEGVERLPGAHCYEFFATAPLFAALRGAGIPARYVSGYIFGGDSTVLGAEASHAWCEAYLPPYGWVGFDPTNDRLIDDSFVRVAVGRDYGDVSPVRGIYRGGGASEMSVNVAMDLLTGTQQQ